MRDRMRRDRSPVESNPWMAAPARVRDLIGYGALIVAPHPDDEVLGCGGLIASVPDPDAVDVLVVTDGSESPPGAAGQTGLGAARQAESLHALEMLGVPTDRVSFLGLPDGGLGDRGAELDRALRDAVLRTAATDVFVPFRFDRHPDHQAVQAAGERLLRRTGIRLWEYFVYPFWCLLPGGDVRGHLRRGALYALDLTPEVRSAKRAALDAYRSQTTRYAEGQTRPVLGAAFLDRMCAGSETFLRYEIARPGAAVLRRSRWWFPVVRRLEPPLKRAKDALVERVGGDE